MKVLLISPPIGGIDTYVRRLGEALGELGLQVTVDGSRNNELAFDTKIMKWKSSHEVKKIAEKIAERIPFEDYDIVAFHYGKNDIEQYLPVVLARKEKEVPHSVYFVHYLSRNLFSEYLGDPLAREEVEEQVGSFYKGYVFFGRYAKEFMEKQYQKQFNGVINYLPETHAHEVLNSHDLEKLEKQFIHPAVSEHNLPFIAWPGFPAHYKDHDLLLKVLEGLDQPIALLFAGAGWEKCLGFSESRIGNCFVYCVDKYLSSREYLFLARRSLFGIFLYRQPDNTEEKFQGSGTLPNFIYEGRASIVLDDGAMAEYVGDAGIVLGDKDPRGLIVAIQKLLNPQIRAAYEKAAIERRGLFSIETHARTCLSFFDTLLENSC